MSIHGMIKFTEITYTLCVHGISWNQKVQVGDCTTQWHECLNRLSLGTDSFQLAWWRSPPPRESSSKSSAKKTSEV